jgi:hypothetical protein
MLVKRLCRVLVLFAAAVAPFATQPPPVGAAAVGPEAILKWNAIALRTAVQVAKQSVAQGGVSVAFAQAAVYDAVVAIVGRYQSYKLNLARRTGASVDAAVATAAHHTLVHYFPAQQAALDADYDAALAAIPAGPAKDAGVQVGVEAAVGIVVLRLGDGLEADIGFTLPAPAPGVWQLPAGQTPATPWLSRLRPFLIESPDQFRPGPPPALTSWAWAVEYNEVKRMGGISSTLRTAEQSDLAKFFTANPIVQYNTAYAYLVQQHHLDAMEAARLYAMGNLVGTDAHIACFDTKYRYLFWRPQFAIPQGDADGNPYTAGDPAWKPLVATPTHPEYPSTHACFSTAQAEALTAFLGTDRIDVDLTSNVPGLLHPVRHYLRAEDLIRDVANARVRGGIHYRGSVNQGTVIGRKVARYALARYFLPAG